MAEINNIKEILEIWELELSQPRPMCRDCADDGPLCSRGTPCDREVVKELRMLVDSYEKSESKEDAIFAKGYRSGYFDGSGATAFESEVANAHEIWNSTGRKTHKTSKR